MDLANKVKKRREELGWSQEELAQKMGYSSRSSINKIEKGRPCSQKIIMRLSKVLDVSIAYLMGWDTEIIDQLSQITQDANDYDDKMELYSMIKELDLSKKSLENLYEYAKYLASQERKDQDGKA